METMLSHQERKNKRRGVTTSVIVHILLILLALWPLLTFPDPPPGQEGILVNLGLPDMGEGDDNAGPVVPAEPEEAQPEEVVEEVDEPEESEPEVAPEPEPVEKEVVKTEDPNEIALKRKKEEERKKQEEADRKKREEEAKKKREAEAKRKAEEAEAKRKAEEARKKAEADALKDQIGGLFGEGDGKGNTGKPGNQGDPGGDPDASKLEGISTGSGRVGGGLGNRGVARTHTPTDNSQEQGTIVVKVCVDQQGNVTSADFTQRGSTSTSSKLKSIAISSAKKWKFKPVGSGGLDEQCGTITYNFKVK